VTTSSSQHPASQLYIPEPGVDGAHFILWGAEPICMTLLVISHSGILCDPARFYFIYPHTHASGCEEQPRRKLREGVQLTGQHGGTRVSWAPGKPARATTRPHCEGATQGVTQSLWAPSLYRGLCRRLPPCAWDEGLSDVSRKLNGIAHLMSPMLGESLNENCDTTGRSEESQLR
jgi:hypothetical protein